MNRGNFVNGTSKATCIYRLGENTRRLHGEGSNGNASLNAFVEQDRYLDLSSKVAEPMPVAVGNLAMCRMPQSGLP